MYLSQLVLDLEQPQVRLDLADRYELHRTLSQGFDALQPARLLWRLEVGRPGEPPRLLVQSLTAPDWERVADRHHGYFLEHRSKRLDLPAALAAGQRLRFRLEANPTVTRAGKRHGLWQWDDQRAWLMRQAERGGFALEDAVVSRQERLVVRRRDGARGIVLHSVLFDGWLRVADPARLGGVLAEGIGHGKALGLGLLSVGSG